MINDEPHLIADSFVVPDDALDLVPEPLRDPASENNELPTPGDVQR